jgi:hypothetical protein
MFFPWRFSFEVKIRGLKSLRFSLMVLYSNSNFVTILDFLFLNQCRNRFEIRGPAKK